VAKQLPRSSDIGVAVLTLRFSAILQRKLQLVATKSESFPKPLQKAGGSDTWEAPVALNLQPMMDVVEV